MDSYQDVLGSAVALAIFIPMLIGTGGALPALKLHLHHHRAWPWAMWTGATPCKSGCTSCGAAVMGSAMGLVAFALAWLWVGQLPIAINRGPVDFGIVIWSTSAGSLLPLIANKLNIDPTVVSAPAMSTIVDATGLIIYFNIARLVLQL